MERKPVPAFSPDFPEAQTIIVFSTPENQSTQQLRLRRTGPAGPSRLTEKTGAKRGGKPAAKTI
jgi:hypothetical protein